MGIDLCTFNEDFWDNICWEVLPPVWFFKLKKRKINILSNTILVSNKTKSFEKKYFKICCHSFDNLSLSEKTRDKI